MNLPTLYLFVTQKKSMSIVLQPSFISIGKVAKNLSLPTCMFPEEAEQGYAWPCFSPHVENTCPLPGLPSVTIFLAFFKLFLVILMFKMTSNHSAEAVFSVPKFEKAVMCLIEKIRA